MNDRVRRRQGEASGGKREDSNGTRFTRREIWGLVAGCGAAAGLSGCGYHVGGQGDLIPTAVKTIAVPTFANRTTQYKLRDEVPIAISREFRARTKYQIINDPTQADAVLSGEITLVSIAPTIYNPTTSEATAIGVTAYINIRFVERATGKVIFMKNGMTFRENYELAVDPSKYFDESEFAMSRLSETVASKVVNLILEAF